MTPAIVPDKVYILHAIDVVLNECIKSQLTSPDVAVGQEILGLQNARFAVEQQWPLSDAMKAKLNIEPLRRGEHNRHPNFGMKVWLRRWWCCTMF